MQKVAQAVPLTRHDLMRYMVEDSALANAHVTNPLTHMGVGTAVGTPLGALIGAIVAKNRGEGSGKGAVAGAIAGGLAGLGLGTITGGIKGSIDIIRNKKRRARHAIDFVSTHGVDDINRGYDAVQEDKQAEVNMEKTRSAVRLAALKKTAETKKAGFMDTLVGSGKYPFDPGIVQKLMANEHLRRALVGAAVSGGSAAIASKDNKLRNALIAAGAGGLGTYAASSSGALDNFSKNWTAAARDGMGRHLTWKMHGQPQVTLKDILAHMNGQNGVAQKAVSTVSANKTAEDRKSVRLASLKKTAETKKAGFLQTLTALVMPGGLPGYYFAQRHQSNGGGRLGNAAAGAAGGAAVNALLAGLLFRRVGLGRLAARNAAISSAVGGGITGLTFGKKE